MPYDLDEIWRKSQVFQSISDKGPTQPVISFHQVDLDGHPTFLTTFFPHGMEYLLSNNNVILTVSFRNKGTLSWANDVLKPPSDSASDNFCNGLVEDITKTNQTELLHRRDIISLRNKSNEGGVQLFYFPQINPYVFDHAANRIPNSRPLAAVKNGLKGIRTRSFEGSNVLYSIPDLCIINASAKVLHVVILQGRKMPSQGIGVALFLSRKKLSEVICSHTFQISPIVSSSALTILEGSDMVSSSTNGRDTMKKPSIPVPIFKPFGRIFLEPKKLLLGKDVFILLPSVLLSG